MNLKKSEELYQKAKDVLPGGVSSPVRAIKPYPFYTDSAYGSKIKDIDGNEYIDYCMGYGPNIFGHSNPIIRKAIVDQLNKGWLFGTPIENEFKLADKITDYYPSIDMLRFVSTGTEATMSALRTARGFTGKINLSK